MSWQFLVSTTLPPPYFKVAGRTGDVHLRRICTRAALWIVCTLGLAFRV